jgi:hypothetical protein
MEYKMYAVREITDIKNNNIIVKLPKDFPTKKVEVIILPLNEKISKKNFAKNIELPEMISIEMEDYTSNIILEDRR